MNGTLHHYIDHLKKTITSQSGIRQINPSDCKFLSAEVFTETGKRISETTLKRIFGFAYSKFAPSLFTLNALCEYCGYPGWDSFCSAQQKNGGDSIDPNLERITAAAEKITRNTLHMLKARSGIPYDKTISRSFFDAHMQVFLAGDYTATVFSAPADYGKTIALCHWVDELILRSISEKRNDIILFFSSSILYNPSVVSSNINEWLMALLGIYDDAELRGLADLKRETGNFYLIIDGIQDDINTHTNTLLSQIIDIISLFNESSWLKVVMTIRSPAWVNNRHLIEGRDQQWFQGFMEGENNEINVPLLSYDEISEISNRLSPQKQEALDPQLLEAFCFPLCLQYLFKIYGSNFSLESATEFTVFEAVSMYFLQRIYRSRHNQDIVMLLMELSDEMDIKNGSFTVNRMRVNDLLRKYEKAYHELLCVGFLQEFNQSDENNYLSYLRISHKYSLTRVLAERLLFENNHVLDNNLIDRFNERIGHSPIRLDVLKWCIYLTVADNHLFSFHALDRGLLKIKDKNDLCSFLTDLVCKFPKVLLNQRGVDFQYDHDNIGYFLGPECINKGYEHTLSTLLAVQLTEKYRIMVLTSAAVLSVIQLDLKKLEDQIALLKTQHPMSYLQFSINPLTCLETIFFYLKFGTIKKEALAMLTKFIFNPERGHSESYSTGFEEVLHLLGLYTLSICRNERKNLRFINALKKVYPEGSLTYQFLRMVIEAEVYLAIGNNNKALRIYEDLFLVYTSMENSITDFMKVSYYALRVKIESLSSSTRVENINTLLRFCDDALYKLIKVHSLAFLLSKDSPLKKDSDVFEYYYFDLLKTTRSNGCRVESFVDVP